MISQSVLPSLDWLSALQPSLKSPDSGTRTAARRFYTLTTVPSTSGATWNVTAVSRREAMSMTGIVTSIIAIKYPPLHVRAMDAILFALIGAGVAMELSFFANR